MEQNQRSSAVLKESTERVIPRGETTGEEKQAQEGSGFFQLFRFADQTDYFLMALGTVGALALGASTPLFILFWGDFTNVFGGSVDTLVEMAWEALKKFIYLGIGTLFAGWFMIACWLISGERQATRCRKAYFASLLRQEIGWFDCINQSELSSNFMSDTQTFQGAIGEKTAVMIHVLGTFIGGLSIAFAQGWLMTLVCLAAFPLIAYAGFLYMRALQTKNAEFQRFYSKAGGLAEQAFYSIKTVKQLNGEEHEERTYEDCLGEVKSESVKFGAKLAASMAFMYSAMFLLYSLGYWFGSHCADPGSPHCPTSASGKLYSAGDVITVFFSVLVGCFNLSQLSPALKKIGEARMSAARIFAIIDREPAITNPPNGLKPDAFRGHIRFEGVSFAYPKDRKRLVLNDLSIEFHVSNTALVGESGCGKSTILQLIMRFYDPDNGRILLDGNDLRELDLNWLRNQIGYVGQEPVLFASSIRENLKLGYEHATEEEIKHALHQAEAYDFVFNQLEDGLETYVGSGGGQISGGQKQRIAIARALLKKPKILLLDEATSALDRRNEKLIQGTLNKISKGLTTVTVAHRVQSIMNANLIYVINRGQIEESGTFTQLARYRDYENKEAEDAEEPLKEDQLTLEFPLQAAEGRKRSQTIKSLTEAKAVSKSKEEAEKEANLELIKKHEDGVYRRVFSYLRTQHLAFVLGILLTVAIGGIYPIFALFLSDIITGLFDLSKSSTHDKGRSSADVASLVFLVLAAGGFAVTFLRDLLTYVVGDEVTNNLRREAYNKMLKMPVEWFDKSENNCGLLSKRLGADCQAINGMATTYIYISLSCATTFVAGLVIALVYEWRTALVALGFMPLVMLAGAIRTKFRSGLSQQEDAALKDSSQIVMESLTNIRTVVSFGVENTVLHKYGRYIDAPHASLTRNSVISGFFFGVSQIMTFLVFGILFYIGTLFIRDYGVTILDVFTAIYEIFFSGITIGNNSHFMPDMNEAKIAAAHIFDILDSEDEEQMQKRENSRMLREGISGHIKLEGVSFKYETRQTHVFRDINVEIHPGQKVAFVGPSGCGKSTILQLLQRFYFPDAGAITIDGIDIRHYDIHYLRSKFGVVSQEPVLFNGTFRENIKYNKYDAPETDIRMVTAEANALAFIEGDEKIHNPDGKEQPDSKEQADVKGKGFDKNVGIKGSHISGGQKQRVAIARAILRKPEILLLDEATSALDAANEQKVQESLDKIMRNKTTITIAHRIETIKNSDVINVFEKGEIVERGTYDQLLAMKGFFYNLERGTQFV